MLQVVVKTSQVNGLDLNGVALQNVNWIPIANTLYSYGYIPVVDNQIYTLSHSDPLARFMSLLYGSADRESFYFPLDIVRLTLLSILIFSGQKIKFLENNSGFRASFNRW